MNKKFKCLSCSGNKYQLIYNFGNIPLVNSFNFNFKISNKKYPLAVVICKDCLVCQLSDIPPAEILYSNYQHFSSASKDNINHINKFCKILQLILKPNSKVLEVGCNDGTMLRILDSEGFEVVGIDPAKNMSSIAIHKRLNTIFENFGKQSITKLLKNRKTKKFDCVLGLNVFAHFSSVPEAFWTIYQILKDEGIIIFEVAYAFDTIFSGIYDTVYHEHVFNHTVIGLKNILSAANLKIIGINKIATQGGSIRVFAVKDICKKKYKIVNDQYIKLLNYENKQLDCGKKRGGGGELFALRIKKKITESIKLIKLSTRKFIEKDEPCFLIGSPARGVVIVNTCLFNFYSNLIPIDDTKEKGNKYFPGINAKVKNWNFLKKNQNIRKCILLSWNYRNTMISKLKANGFQGEMLCFFPQIDLIKI
jgi:SAM-dependent methyltransferase